MVDTTAAAPKVRVVAEPEVLTFALSSSGTKLFYTRRNDSMSETELYVVALPDGVPEKIGQDPRGVRFAGDVVYFQEFARPTKTATLKAYRASGAGVVTVAEGLDPLTTRTLVVGSRLLAGSKLGLWEYAAVAP